MAEIIITMHVRLETPDTDPEVVREMVKGTVEEFGGMEVRQEIEELAFGLKQIKLIFILDEDKSNLDPLEDALKDLDGVSSTEIIQIGRTLG